jgi:hypothetical protein
VRLAIISRNNFTFVLINEDRTKMDEATRNKETIRFGVYLTFDLQREKEVFLRRVKNDKINDNLFWSTSNWDIMGYEALNSSAEPISHNISSNYIASGQNDCVPCLSQIAIFTK